MEAVTGDLPSNYYVYYDENVTDVLVVAADPTAPPYVPPEDVPTCDIEGYDCECERLPPVDPFSRKPVPDNDGYTFYDRDVGGWTDYKYSLGWDGGWTPIPDGYWGYWLFLEQWDIFGYGDWEEWNFGVVIRSEDTGQLVDWPFTGGVEFIDEAGDYVYEYAIKIPDQPEVEVGDCFTPVYYDATLFAGVYVMGETPAYDGPTFCIGEPYRPQTGYESEVSWIEAIYTFADTDGDGCATYDELISLYQWGMQDGAAYETFVDEYFLQAAGEDGLVTWAELNQWLPTVEGDMLPDEAEAMKAFF